MADLGNNIIDGLRLGEMYVSLTAGPPAIRAKFMYLAGTLSVGSYEQMTFGEDVYRALEALVEALERDAISVLESPTDDNAEDYEDEEGEGGGGLWDFSRS